MKSVTTLFHGGPTSGDDRRLHLDHDFDPILSIEHYFYIAYSSRSHRNGSGWGTHYGDGRGNGKNQSWHYSSRYFWSKDHSSQLSWLPEQVYLFSHFIRDRY